MLLLQSVHAITTMIQSRASTGKNSRHQTDTHFLGSHWTRMDISGQEQTSSPLPPTCASKLSWKTGHFFTGVGN